VQSVIVAQDVPGDGSIAVAEHVTAVVIPVPEVIFNQSDAVVHNTHSCVVNNRPSLAPL